MLLQGIVEQFESLDDFIKVIVRDVTFSKWNNIIIAADELDKALKTFSRKKIKLKGEQKRKVNKSKDCINALIVNKNSNKNKI